MPFFVNIFLKRILVVSEKSPYISCSIDKIATKLPSLLEPLGVSVREGAWVVAHVADFCQAGYDPAVQLTLSASLDGSVADQHELWIRLAADTPPSMIVPDRYFDQIISQPLGQDRYQVSLMKYREPVSGNEPPFQIGKMGAEARVLPDSTWPQKGIQGIREQLVQLGRSDPTVLESVMDQFMLTHLLYEDAQRIAKIGIWEVDLASQHAFWSDEVYRIHEVPMGTPIEIAKGIHFYREDFRGVIADAIVRSVESFATWDLECVLVTQKGNEIWVRSIGEPVVEAGKVVKIRGMFQDIDEQKRLRLDQEAKAHDLRAIVHNTLDLIWSVNLQYELIVFNPAFAAAIEQATGTSPEEGASAVVIGYPQSAPQPWQTYYERAFYEGAFSEEIAYEENNQPRYQKASFYPIYGKNNKLVGCDVHMVDITELKLSEQEIEENEFRFRNIFNHTFNSIGLLASDGTIIEVNQTALDSGGYTMDQVLGAKFYDAPWWTLDQEGVDELKWAIGKAAKGEFVRYDVEVPGTASNTFFDFSITPIADEAGKVIFLIPEARDITERIRLEKSLEVNELQRRRFISKAPIAVAMLDDEMRYMAASKQWWKDYKIEETDLIGKSHYEIFPEILEMSDWLAAHQRVLAGESISSEKDKFVRLDGSVHWMNYTLIPWLREPGVVGGMVMYTVDITDQIVYEEKLQDLNKELERQVEERTGDLQLQQLRLTRQTEELQQFAYAASHDLQEPLRIITSYMEILQEEFSHEISSDSAVYINKSVQAATRMRKLISDLLAYSSVSRKEIIYADTDLNEVVAEVLENLEVGAEQSHAHINYGHLPTIAADPGQMQQLFQNLIGNAFKYHKPGEAPEVEIEAELVGDQYRFTVKDQGIGIDPEYGERIFKIFHRLHTRNEFPGTGIGLSICKRILEHHNGHIWVESELGKGSTFIFTIPVDSEAGPEQA